MPLLFDDWKRCLLESAGSARASISQLGDYVLELFWKDGCEPNLSAMLDYAQAGLCRGYNVEAGAMPANPAGHHTSVTVR